MGYRDLGEPDLPRQCRDLALVLSIAIAVQQDDGDCAYAGSIGGCERGSCRIEINRAQHLAFRRHALVDLDHALIEHLR
jgi:hypothetical protein